MSLIQYSTTEIFDFSQQLRPYVLAVTANAGTVVFAVEVTTGVWQEVTTYSADAVEQVMLSGARLRFSPTGAATYSINAKPV